MAKEINTLINSLIEVQKHRDDNKNMRVCNVRIVDSGRQYYATVVISSEAIIIQPENAEIADSHFRPVHVMGFKEVGLRGLVFNLYSNAQVEIHFRTERQMAGALRRVRQLTGSESTSEESSKETAECASAPSST